MITTNFALHNLLVKGTGALAGVGLVMLDPFSKAEARVVKRFRGVFETVTLHLQLPGGRTHVQETMAIPVTGTRKALVAVAERPKETTWLYLDEDHVSFPDGSKRCADIDADVDKEAKTITIRAEVNGTMQVLAVARDLNYVIAMQEVSGASGGAPAADLPRGMFNLPFQYLDDTPVVADASASAEPASLEELELELAKLGQ